MYLSCNNNWNPLFNKIKSFLEGQNPEVAKEIKAKMLEASENEEFEKAQDLKNTLDGIEYVLAKQGGAVNFYVDFGTSAFETFSLSGTKKAAAASTESTFTATNNGDGKYFCITAAKNVGDYRKNGGIAKVVITLN